MRCKRFVLGLLLAMFSLSASASHADGDYAVAASVVLHRSMNGTDGVLQLLVDKRLTESVWQQLWGKGEWDVVLPRTSAYYKEFSITPPRPAEIIIRDDRGKILTARKLKTPLAKLGHWDLPSTATQLFTLTTDYSAGFGSYNGLETTLFEVSGASIRFVKANRIGFRDEKVIRLVKSLKSDWTSNNGDEILAVSCKAKDGGFVVVYSRYSLSGTRWQEYEHETSGFWESDQPFPKRSAFP